MIVLAYQPIRYSRMFSSCTTCMQLVSRLRRNFPEVWMQRTCFVVVFYLRNTKPGTWFYKNKSSENVFTRGLTPAAGTHFDQIILTINLPVFTIA